MSSLLTTINCKGLRDDFKRKCIFYRCKELGINISFLQETHLISKREFDTWIKEWGGRGCWSFGQWHSCGVGILLGSKFDYNFVSFRHDFEGRLLVLDIDVNNTKLRLVNVYCPNNAKERKEFIDNLNVYLSTSRKIILGGDWNFVENVNLDKEGGNPLYGDVGKVEMKNLCNVFDLKDVFRFKFPDKKVFTFQQQDVKCRLDRFYFSRDLLNFVQDAYVTPCIHSDHDYFNISLNNLDPSGFQNGPGYWKCNVKLLDDIDLITKIENIWKSDLSKVRVKDGEWWENCKIKFRDILMDHGKGIAKSFRVKLKTLESELHFIQGLQANVINNHSFLPEIEQIKEEINILLKTQLEGSKIRSRIKFLDNVEKPTSYFLRKEKRNGKKKFISKLTDPNDNTIYNDKDNITRICRTFYSNLFSFEDVDQNVIDFLLKDVPQLDQENRELCEGLLNYDECIAALKSMKNNKTPGSDGLPKEFYVKFFYLFGQDFINMINACYLGGLLPESLREGLISLICKDFNKDVLLNFWRPISLLNCDFKLVSKALCNRMRKVLPFIIHRDQACAILGRSITDCVHVLRNVFDYVEQKDIPCAFINIDQSKAFDRVSHSFLFQVLKGFGFGPSFINWIKLLYNNIYSSVIVNGHVTASFPVLRSVRQGCSLSPLLYVTCIEIFAIQIRKSTRIKGLSMPGVNGEHRITQYADDNTCIITNLGSIDEIFRISDLYSRASGAKINMDKSCGFWLGRWKDNRDQPGNLKWESLVKCLGYRFTHGDVYKENWKPVISKLSKVLDDHKFRNLSMKGKAVLCNVGALSKILYIASILSLPKTYLKDIESLIFSFVWNDKTEWVKRNTLYLPYLQGGIGLACVTAKVHTYRVMHVKQLIYGEFQNWMPFAIYWIGFNLRKFRPSFGSNLIPHSVTRPKFYEDVLESFDLLFSICPDFDLQTATSRNVYQIFLKTFVQIPRVVVRHPTLNFNAVFNDVLNKFLCPELRDLNWKIVHEVLPVSMFLFLKNISTSSTCAFCNQAESINHLFVSCYFARNLWTYVKDIVCNMFPISFQITSDFIIFHKIPLGTSMTASDKEMYFLILSLGKYCIWFIRNRKKFDHVNVRFKDLLNLFNCKLKSRCLVDGCRLSLEDFVKRWSKGRVIAVKSRGGMVDFLL